MQTTVTLHPNTYKVLTDADAVVRQKQGELLQAQQQVQAVFLTAVAAFVDGPPTLVSADHTHCTLVVETPDPAPMTPDA